MDELGLPPRADEWERARRAYKNLVAECASVDASNGVMNRINERGTNLVKSSVDRSYSLRYRSAAVVLGFIVLFSGFTYAAASGKISFLKNTKGEVVMEFVTPGGEPIPPEHREIVKMVKEQLLPGEEAKIYIGPNDKLQLENLIKSPERVHVTYKPYSIKDLHSFPGISKSAYKNFQVPKLNNGYKLLTTEIVNTGFQNTGTPDGPIQYQTSPAGQLYAFSKKPMGPVMSQIILTFRKNDLFIYLSVSYTYSLRPNILSWDENKEMDVVTINETEVLFNNYTINSLLWTEMRDNGKFTFSLSSEKASKEQLIQIAKQIANKTFTTP